MLDSQVHDFLGQELNVGDVIVYPVSRASRADMVKAEIVSVGAAGSTRVRRLADSGGGSSWRPGSETYLHNTDRCVRVEKHSPVVVDLAGDH